MKIIKIPANQNRIFKKLSLGRFEEAEALVDDTFGKGTFFKQTWDSGIRQWIALQEDPWGGLPPYVVGYCSVKIEQERLLGILKTSVVDRCRRVGGIGDAMVKHRLNWLQKKNVKTIRSYAWFVDGVVPAQKMLMNNGFKPVDDVRGYWNKDHNEAYPCKICGANCKCVARIFEYEG